MIDNRFSLFAEVDKAEVFLSLKNRDIVIEQALVCDGCSIVEKMLPAIDAMLRRHHLQTGDIKKFEVISDLPEGYSARRITETIASIYGFACV
jgi:hypothetical protein